MGSEKPGESLDCMSARYRIFRSGTAIDSVAPIFSSVKFTGAKGRGDRGRDPATVQRPSVPSPGHLRWDLQGDLPTVISETEKEAQVLLVGGWCVRLLCEETSGS